METPLELQQGDRLQCLYDEQCVMGTVLHMDAKTCLIRLETDYIGKNVEWYAGETKLLQRRIMKETIKTPPAQGA